MIELNNGNEVAEGNLEVRVDNAQGIGVAENRNSSVIRDIDVVARASTELGGASAQHFLLVASWGRPLLMRCRKEITKAERQKSSSLWHCSFLLVGAAR